jgi:O-antigen/teichoic acid export membrane protein
MSSHVLSLGFVVLAARSLGVETFGRYLFAASLASWLTIASAFGLDLLVIRQLAREPLRSREIFTSALFTRLGLWAAGLLVLLAGVSLRGGDRTTLSILLLLSLSGLATLLGNCGAAVMASRELFWPRVVADLIGNSLRVGTAFLAVRLGFGAVGVAFAVFCSSVLGGSLCLGYAASHFRIRIVRIRRADVVGLIRSAVPYGLAGIFFALYFRLPLVLVATLRGEAEAGLYGAAFKGIETWVLVPGSILGAVYPVLARMQDPRDPRFAAAVGLLARFVLAIGFPVAVFAAANAGELIRLFYGSGFAAAAGPLVWLSPFFPLIALNYVYGTALYAAGCPRAVVKAEILGLAAVIAAGMLLVPRFGIAGAAASAVVMETIVVACNAYSLKKSGIRLTHRGSFLPAMPIALGIGIPLALVSLPLALEGLLAAALYAGLMILFRGVRDEDRRWLVENLPDNALRRVLSRIRLLPEVEPGPELTRGEAVRRMGIR